MSNEKNDKLEMFVKQNREAFDDFDPPAHLFHQIAGEVKKRKAPQKKQRTLLIVRNIAASIVIALAAYGLADIALGLKKNSEELADVAEEHNPNHELGEAMLYYTAQISHKKVELEEKAKQYPEILHEIKSEFEELDEEYHQLEADLKEDVSNQMVLEAMIRNAKIKLEILEEMNRQMIRIEEKNKHHDKTTQL